LKIKTLILIFAVAILSLLKSPSIAPIVGVLCLLTSLAVTLFSIFEKYKKTEKPRIKIAKDIMIFIFTFLLISLLSGLAGMFANFYAGNLFGSALGFICAILLSFVIGYSVRKGIKKLSETSP
jgi:hypothetical protein